MARRNPPIGQDSAVDYGTGVVTLGTEDKYVLPEMRASVRRAADETLSGKRLPIIDPDAGEQIGFTGSKTLKPEWMLDPKGKGKYFEPEETLKVLDGLGRGRWPKTKKQERIAGQIEQALYMDAETEKALAAGGSEDGSPKTDAGGPEFLHSLEFSRPRVQVDLAGRAFTLGKRSPYKGKVNMVNRSGLAWRVEIYSPGAARPSRVFSRLSESDAKTVAKRVLAQAQTLGWNIRVRVTDDDKKNPLTRRETADVLREARQDFRRAKRAPTGTPSRAYRLGRADVGQAIAYQHGEAKLLRMRGREWMMNPHWVRTSGGTVGRVIEIQGGPRAKQYLLDVPGKGPVWAKGRMSVVPAPRKNPRDHSPRVVGIIPGRMTRIEYQRTGAHPGRYYHDFKPGVSARVLSDGSVLLQGPRRLHVKE